MGTISMKKILATLVLHVALMLRCNAQSVEYAVTTTNPHAYITARLWCVANGLLTNGASPADMDAVYRCFQDDAPNIEVRFYGFGPYPTADDLADPTGAIAWAATQKVEEAEAALTPFKRAARRAVEGMIKASDLSEGEIAALVDVFAPWKSGSDYATNAVVRHAGQVYACIQAHKSQSDWYPDAVPALWARRSPAATVIEVWVQPYGGSGTYTEGAVVQHDGKTWTNTVSAPTLNVWEPGVYGWQITP